MTHYSSVNVKLCDSRLTNLKSATKDVNKTTAKLPSNMIGDSNDETNFFAYLFSFTNFFNKIVFYFINHFKPKL